MDLKDLAINAEIGNPASQFALGMAYYNGEGVAQNYAEAFKWLTAAADQDYAEAQHNLAVMYEKGQGCARDFLKAGELYARAAVQKNGDEEKQDLGTVYAAADVPEPAPEEEFALWLRKAQDDDAEAQFQVARRYAEGRGIDCDYAAAAGWFAKAAEQDHAFAQYNLGLLYFNGWGFETNYPTALSWFERAARQNYADAQYYAGLCYEHALGVSQDYRTAVQWYTAAAGQKHVAAMYNLGYLHLLGLGVERDYSRALTLFTDALNNTGTDNNAAGCCQTALAFIYMHGLGCSPDYARALKLYRTAPQDDINARAGLGYMFYKGYGAPENYAKALEHLSCAANSGHAVAQYNLGCIYCKGHGTAKDYHEAFKWFSRAAANGENNAQRRLSRMYLSGTGVTKNLVKAYQWQIIADVGFGYDDTEESFCDDVIMPPTPMSLGRGMVSPFGRVTHAVGNFPIKDHHARTVNPVSEWFRGLKKRLSRRLLQRSLTSHGIRQAQRLAAEYWEQPACPVMLPKWMYFGIPGAVGTVAEKTDNLESIGNPPQDTTAAMAETPLTPVAEPKDTIKLKYN